MGTNNTIDRKEFLKKFAGLGLSASAILYGCGFKKKGQKTTAEQSLSSGTMTYRKNPRTGNAISILGYGCMRWPFKKGSDGKELIDQDAVNSLIDYSIENGVNYFDTSPVYGRGKSEQATGIALKRHNRNKFFVATKLSNFRPETFSREASIAMYKNSFKELQVDYIDYYLLHAVGLPSLDNFKARYIDNGIIDFLLKEREAGRIKNLGWSFHGDIKVFEYLLAMDVDWDFVQIQMNYLDWKHASGWNTNAEYLYEKLAERKIPVVVMEPLLGGRLAQLNYDATNLLKQKRPSDSIASWAFRYAASYPNVLTVLSGMTYKEHLVENINTYSPLEVLTDDEFALIFEVAKMTSKFPVIACTDCKYCLPCPYGLDIPAILTHYNKCITEGNVPKNKQDKNYRKARQAFLIGYKRKIPKLRQADHCIGCNICVPKCPQRIQIPQEMARVHGIVEKLRQG